MIINTVGNKGIGSGLAPLISVTVDTGSTVTATCNGQTVTETSVDNNCKIRVPSYGTWTVSATKDGESSTFEIVVVNVVKVYSVTLSYPTYLPVGGRIFYIHYDNGATYKFLDANYNVITDITVSGLANAAYYAIVNGTPSADKFYVYDTTNGFVTKYWSRIMTHIGIRDHSIGAGKPNTETLLTYSMGDNSIFTYIQTIRNDNLGGCNDWFAGSVGEYRELYESDLLEITTQYWTLTSCEYLYDASYYWFACCMDDEDYMQVDKSKTRPFIAIRSF